MASKQSSLLILALAGPSHGTAYPELSTPMKVKTNLCLMAFLFVSSIFLLPFFPWQSFLLACFFLFILSIFFFFLTFVSIHLLLSASVLPHISFTSPISLSVCLYITPCSLFLSPHYLVKVKTHIIDTVYRARARNVHKYLHKTFLYHCGLVIFSGTSAHPLKNVCHWHIAQLSIQPQMDVFPHESP